MEFKRNWANERFSLSHMTKHEYVLRKKKIRNARNTQWIYEIEKIFFLCFFFWFPQFFNAISSCLLLRKNSKFRITFCVHTKPYNTSKPASNRAHTLLIAIEIFYIFWYCTRTNYTVPRMWALEAAVMVWLLHE